jgi:hypothetical protein
VIGCQASRSVIGRPRPVGLLGSIAANSATRRASGMTGESAAAAFAGQLAVRLTTNKPQTVIRCKFLGMMAFQVGVLRREQQAKGFAITLLSVVVVHAAAARQATGVWVPGATPKS